VVGPVQSGVGVPSEYFALEPRSYGVTLTRKDGATDIPITVAGLPPARPALADAAIGPSRQSPLAYREALSGERELDPRPAQVVAKGECADIRRIDRSPHRSNREGESRSSTGQWLAKAGPWS
jgi:hypothetical protein